MHFNATLLNAMEKKISFPLWLCWLQSDAVLKLIRTLWSDVMRGWPHGTVPPGPFPHPLDCNHSELTHHYCRTLGHLIQTEGPTRLLFPLCPAVLCPGGGFSPPLDKRSRRSDSFSTSLSSAVRIITLQVVWSCSLCHRHPPFIFRSCSSLSAYLWSWANKIWQHTEDQDQHGKY